MAGPSRSASDTRASGSSEATDDRSELRKWGEALVVALIIVVIVRALFFDLFRIPTPSMEKNLLVGDYLFVSKLHYGTRLPMSVGVPFTSIHVPGISFPYVRGPGFSEVQRGDAIVFNYPPDDGPIDSKTHYVKRVIGLPGDTVAVRDKMVHINEDPLPLGKHMQQHWLVRKSDARYQIPRSRMEEIGVSNVTPTKNARLVRVLATPAGVRELSQRDWVESIRPYVVQNMPRNGQMYPPDRDYTPDNYGPLHIPAKGETVRLTDRNWAAYRPLIVRHENHDAQQMTDSTFAIDGDRTTTYTFEQDYFFAMGDNRDNSQDSRFWGPVPKDHLVGKATLTYFSWDSERWMPRFWRIMNPIEDDDIFRETPVLKQLQDSVTARSSATQLWEVPRNRMPGSSASPPSTSHGTTASLLHHSHTLDGN